MASTAIAFLIVVSMLCVSLQWHYVYMKRVYRVRGEPILFTTCIYRIWKDHRRRARLERESWH